MHDPDRWLRLNEHLDRALDIPAAARAAWLAEFEREQPDFAGEIRALLSASDDREFGDFLAGPTPAAPAAPESRAVIGRRVGPYVIESEIGRGGMGSVWRALRADGHFEGYVAVKFVHASWLGREGERRFRREGRLLARLNHPHIARLLDAGVLDDGQPYLVLEYVEGQPIDQYCDRRGLDTAARVRLFLGVLDAVAHAHSHLIVHRDIKPTNILVTDAGDTKLLDFGIAKALGADDATSGLTRSGTRALTPDYAAPEQLLGEPVTTATDVYSLGLVLYRLLTGAFPAEGRVLARDLGNILGKAMKEAPAERYPSVGAFADDLQRYLANQPVLARPDTVGYRVAKFVRRHRGSVATALLMLVALVVAAVVTTSQMIEARHQRDLARAELRRSEAFNDLVTIVLSESGPGGAGVTTGELLDRSEKLVRSEFASTPVLRAQLLHTLATLYLDAGMTGKERELARQAHAVAGQTGDPDMLAVTGCLLAQADAAAGELQGTLASVTAYLATLPKDDSATTARAHCLHSASIIERLLGDSSGALADAERADEIVAGTESATRWDKLNSLITLADAERSAGRYAQADTTYQRIADGFERLNVEHSGLAATLYNNWALDLASLGQPGRAAELFERVMDYDRGQSAPDAFTRVGYAATLLPLGRAEDARQMLEPAYANAVANGNRSSAGMVRMALAGTYRELGQFDRADRLLRDTEAQLRTMLPEGHEAFGALHLNRALLAQKRQDYAAALREADLALAIFTARPGLAQRAATTRLTRAEVLLALGRTREARGEVDQSLDALQRMMEPGVRSLHIGRAWLDIARIDAAEKDAAATRTAARHAYDDLFATIGARHPLTVEARALAGDR